MVFVLAYVSPEKTLWISAISLLPLTPPIPSYMFSSLSYLSLSSPSPHCLLLSLLKYICSSFLGLPQPLNYVFSYRYLVLVCRLQESQYIFVRGKIRQEGATSSYIPQCWCSPLYKASTSRCKTSDTIMVGDFGTLQSSLHESPPTERQQRNLRSCPRSVSCKGIFHPTEEDHPFFSAVLGNISQIIYNIGHKANFYKH